MVMASLVCCLLALSSVAFGESSYGSYSYSQPSVRPLLPMGGIRVINSKPQPSPIDFTPEAPVPAQNGYGSSYGNQNIHMKVEPLPQIERVFVQSQGYGSGSPMMSSSRGLNAQPSPPVPEILTEADMLCRGQQQGAIIPTHNSRRFVVCLDDGKGAEQHCPHGLFFHPETQRCERKLGALADPCARLPCLNGGLCKRVEVTSYQCECPAGFDGKSCELDARICLSQQPCGVSNDVRCQSFRWGAALSYVCIFSDGRGYGLNGQQITANPCKDDDKIKPLAFADTGFVLCDGERMSVESCPGGTLWDESFETCVWRDLQSNDRSLVADQSRSYGYSQYSQPKVELPKALNSYGGYQQNIVRDLPKPELPKPINSYGGYQQNLVRELPEPEQPKPINSYGGYQQNIVRELPEPEQPKPINSYGGYQQQQQQQQQPEQIRTINVNREEPTPEIEVPKPTNSYGGYQQQPMPKPQIWQQKMFRSQQPLPQQSSGY